MYQFFYIRKSQRDPKIGSICKAVFVDRTPISRVSLKITIPIKLWDNNKQRVKESELVNHKRINHTLDQLQAEFLQSNNRASKPTKECFIDFALEYLKNEYENVGTKTKYGTILNSLKKYVNEVLSLKSLPVDELRKVDFIKGYTKWLEQRQYKTERKISKKKNKTIFNYLVVVQTFVKKFNESHPHLDEIKTIHYTTQVGKIEKVESRMLYPHEIDKLINYIPPETSKREMTQHAKYHFLFQFFTSGLRVSDILLLNYKHFTNGRVEFVVKKNGDKISIPFGFKSCKMLSHFYPDEYQQAISENLLGNLELHPKELDELIEINSKKNLGTLNIDDLKNLQKFLKQDIQHDNFRKLKVVSDIIITIEQNVADTMCSIMGSKPSGLVFDYLNFEDFKNLKIMDKRELNKDQSDRLHRARCRYNSHLKRIAKDLGIEKLTSHVSRHSFAYFMLSSGATVEEISHAMGHSSIEMTQNYLNQFPSKYSDNAIRKFEAAFEI